MYQSSAKRAAQLCRSPLLISNPTDKRCRHKNAAPLPFRHHCGRRLGYQFRTLSHLGFASMVLADNLAIVRCPSCGGMMKLLRSVPRPEGLPPLLVISCTSCNEVEIKEEKRVA
jgi:hypothetical protein